LQEFNKKFVVIKEVERQHAADFSVVASDGEYGAFMATQHLINQNFKNIGFLSDSVEKSTVMKERYEGFAKALTYHKLPLQEKFVFKIPKNPKEIRLQAARKILTSKELPEALVTATDTLAMSFMSAAFEKGLKIPDDMALISLDGMSFASLWNIQLSTMTQPRDLIGERAAKMIIDQCEGISIQPQYLRLQPYLEAPFQAHLSWPYPVPLIMLRTHREIFPLQASLLRYHPYCPYSHLLLMAPNYSSGGPHRQ